MTMTRQRKMELVHLWNVMGSSARYRDELRDAARADGIREPDTNNEFVTWLFSDSDQPEMIAPTNGRTRNLTAVVEGIFSSPTVRQALTAIKNSGCTLRDPSNLVQMPPEEMWAFVDQILGGIAKPYSQYSERQRNLLNMIVEVYGREMAASRVSG